MKIRTQYTCQTCGYIAPKWMGRCHECGTWDCFVEEVAKPASSQAAVNQELGTGKGWVPLDDECGSRTERIKTGLSEIDRVLGGGLVPDSFVLLGGDPGIGKSTILLQVAKGLSESNSSLKILYVSGEESFDQIRSRAKRLSLKGDARVFLASETKLEQIFAMMKELSPNVIMMDSLQTFSVTELESTPGSVSQVREVAMRLMTAAKSAHVSIWLVGHVTKDGSIAGPKTVEHMVDTVLYFETDTGQSYRLLRAVKNRFGSTRELGIFEMTQNGLKEVQNASSIFLSERREPVPGTAICSSLEGSRPLLVELQALTTTSGLVVPRRTSVGLESARISLIAAILEKHMKLPLSHQDLFFNVAGGLKLNEPACDLAAAAAIWSSHEDVPLPHSWIFIGEIGLTGEVRRVSQIQTRIEEAAKLGFTTAVIPEDAISSSGDKSLCKNIRLVTVKRINDLPLLLRKNRENY
ncbi:MAG: DNA repair protein RadA [Bdellovibrionota bacterium]